MKRATCLFLLFLLTISLKAQEHPYSLLVVKRTAIGPSKEASITYQFHIKQYTGNECINLTEESPLTDLNEVVNILGDLQKAGWQIISSTKNFYAPSMDLNQLKELGAMQVETQEYLLVKKGN